MGFYSALSKINSLLAKRQWRLRRCRRHQTEALHYFVTDADNRVLTPTHHSLRIGLTLQELLLWLEQSNDRGLSEQAHALRADVTSH